jgi:hypothetical protein
VTSASLTGGTHLGLSGPATCMLMVSWSSGGVEGARDVRMRGARAVQYRARLTPIIAPVMSQSTNGFLFLLFLSYFICSTHHQSILLLIILPAVYSIYN